MVSLYRHKIMRPCANLLLPFPKPVQLQPQPQPPSPHHLPLRQSTCQHPRTEPSLLSPSANSPFLHLLPLLSRSVPSSQHRLLNPSLTAPSPPPYQSRPPNYSPFWMTLPPLSYPAMTPNRRIRLTA